MTRRTLSLSAAALALALSGAAAIAAESGPVYGKSVGALAFETRGRATSAAEVRRQGGFASAGAVLWTRTPAAETHASAF